jgi:hypothetical protein
MNRFPCDARYIEALGRAVFNFALLEYAVVHAAEKIERGYLNKYTAKPKTAGMVARDFAKIIARAAQGHPAAGKLTEISSTFAELTERRNKLLHANPATLADGTQALIYQTGACWELDTVTAAAQAFEDAAVKTLDVLQRGFLCAAPD